MWTVVSVINKEGRKKPNICGETHFLRLRCYWQKLISVDNDRLETAAVKSSTVIGSNVSKWKHIARVNELVNGNLSLFTNEISKSFDLGK